MSERSPVTNAVAYSALGQPRPKSGKVLIILRVIVWSAGAQPFPGQQWGRGESCAEIDKSRSKFVCGLFVASGVSKRARAHERVGARRLIPRAGTNQRMHKERCQFVRKTAPKRATVFPTSNKTKHTWPITEEQPADQPVRQTPTPKYGDDANAAPTPRH